MEKIFFILSLFSCFVLAQLPTEEIELIKDYKQNLIDKDINKTITSLQNLIDYHKDETQYHISLGYIYQLQRNRKLAKLHLQKGKEYILEQLITDVLPPKETMDHVVALCFAGFDKECEEMFMFSESRFMDDEHYQDYDFEAVKKLAEKQRNIMNEYFDNK